MGHTNLNFIFEIKNFNGKDLRVMAVLAEADIIHSILQHADAHGGAVGRWTALPSVRLSDTGPIRMIGPVVVGFRMGHQAKYTSGWITDAGDVV